MKTPFFGPAYVSQSSNLADNQLINLYPEVVETRQGKEVGAFYMCPGLDLLVSVGNGPIRSMIVMNGVLYVVSGNTIYSVTNSLAITTIGTISSFAGTVSMITNGTQIALFDGVNGYLISSGSLSTLSLTATHPTIASYQDGFGLVNDSGTPNFYQSNANDLSTWNAANFGQATANPTNIVSIAEVHREQWIFKSDSTEVWVNAGNAGFTFARLDGVFMEQGAAAPYSVARAGESLIWLTQNDQGQCQVSHANGYTPQRVSTHSIERIFQSYPNVQDAIGYTYQQEGHLFYVLTFISGNATWVYDITASSQLGMPCWHQRASFSNGVLNRHRGSGAYAFFNSQHVIGDYQNGNLYAYDLNTATDNGAQRKWVRSWRALPKPTIHPTRFDKIQVDMQTGIQVPDGTSPQCMLRWSDDGGHNWSDYRIGSVGQPGQTSIRVKFNRLGSTKRNGGLDRIFEISSTDQFGVCLIGADAQYSHAPDT